MSWRLYAGILSALCLCAANYKAEYFTQTAIPFVTSNEMNGMVTFTLMKSGFGSEEKLYLGPLF